MKNIRYFFFTLYILAFVSTSCEFNNDDFEGFTDKQVELMLTANSINPGKSWVRTQRFENGLSIDIACDSSNHLRIRNVTETALLKDSVYFSYNLLENCGLASSVKKQGVWRLFPTGTLIKVDSIFIYSSDTLRASIEEITTSKLKLKYNLKADSIPFEVIDVFEALQ